MEIIGKDGSLKEVIYSFPSLDRVLEKNRTAFHDDWNRFRPVKDADNSCKMAIDPDVCIDTVFPESFPKKDPYFVKILNKSRESRPKGPDAGSEEKSHCKLCKNILEKGMIISEIDGFYLTPNGFPYHSYASLLIDKNLRCQNDLRADDIATWMKLSALLGQTVFFNADGAGASITEHLHAQVVDPLEIKVDNKIISYPLFAFTRKQPVKKRLDIFKGTGYIFDSLIFTGINAPERASYAIELLKKEEHAFNVSISGSEVFLVGRDKSMEFSDYLKAKLGTYEILGVFFVGDTKRKLGGLEIATGSQKFFSNLSYHCMHDDLIEAIIPLGHIAKEF